MFTSNDIVLEALSNVLRRKRQERMIEHEKVARSTPGKGYRDALNTLQRDIRILERTIDMVRKEG